MRGCMVGIFGVYEFIFSRCRKWMKKEGNGNGGYGGGEDGERRFGKGQTTRSTSVFDDRLIGSRSDRTQRMGSSTKDKKRNAFCSLTTGFEPAREIPSDYTSFRVQV